MDLKAVLARIEQRLGALKLSADRASRLAGKPDAIRNLKRAVRAGDRQGISTGTISALAPILGTTVAWLITGEGSGEQQGVTLVGYVGADARPDVVVMSAGQGELAHDIPEPPDRRPGTVAVEVRGDSMRGTAKDGWLVYYDADDVQLPPFDQLIGELCVCWTGDGRVLLKELQPGRQYGYFDLESMSADTIREVLVERATKVTFIRPKGRRPTQDALTKSGRQLKANPK